MKILKKQQVKAKIRKQGEWKGYIAGNNVNSFHYFSGWCLACPIEVKSLEELEQNLNSFLFYLDPELGRYARYIER